MIKIVLFSLFSILSYAQLSIVDNFISAGTRSTDTSGYFQLQIVDTGQTVEAYLPMAYTNTGYTYSDHTNIADAATILPTTTTGAYQDIDGNLKLTIKNEGSDGLLGVYVRDKTDSRYELKFYCVSANCTYPGDLTSNTINGSSTLDIYLDIATLCEESNCGSFANGTANGCSASCSTFEDEIEVAIVSLDSLPDEIAEGDASLTDGVSLTIKHSNKLPSPTTAEFPTISAARGDGQVEVTYAASSTNEMDSDELYKLVVAQFGSTQTVQTFAAGDLVDSSKTFYDLDTIPGTLVATGFTNGVTYNIGVAIQNKFQFISNFSATSTVTPTEIETFIDEQSCYLISAGFQREHYVLTALRDFRDNVLMTFELGRRFVELYYISSQELAYSIAHNKVLSNLMKIIGFILYFCIQFWYAAVLILMMGFYLVLRRKKISSSKNLGF